jgi:hypothetical protein
VAQTNDSCWRAGPHTLDNYSAVFDLVQHNAYATFAARRSPDLVSSGRRVLGACVACPGPRRQKQAHTPHFQVLPSLFPPAGASLFIHHLDIPSPLLLHCDLSWNGMEFMIFILHLKKEEAFFVCVFYSAANKFPLPLRN